MNKKNFLLMLLICFSLANCSKSPNQSSSAIKPKLHAGLNGQSSLAAGAWNYSTKRGGNFTEIAGTDSWPAGTLQACINGLNWQSWYYNYTTSQNTMGTVTLPANSQFVPMVYNGAAVTTVNLTNAKTYGNTLLTFNEPDGTSNAMTVAQAISYWPTLQATGMRLGSPAPAGNADNPTSGWLHDFMASANANGYRVDFICLHYYPGYYDPTHPVASADTMIATIKRVFAIYHKPIWLTEFALSCNGNTKATQAQQLAFMNEAQPQLEALPYIEKYCWWTMWWYNWGDWYLALNNQDGSIGNLGNAYNLSTTPAEKVLNGSFETNSLQSWTTWIGTGYTGTGTTKYSGSYGAWLGGGTSMIYQTVYGLQPNTTYTLRLADYISGPGPLQVSVSNSGGTTPSKNVTANSWEQETMTFTTGASNYTAQINFYIGNTGTYGFLDNVSVQ